MSAGLVPIWLQLFAPSGERSTLKLVSLLLASVQVRLICAWEAGLALSPPGAAGMVGEQALAAAEATLL